METTFPTTTKFSNISAVAVRNQAVYVMTEIAEINEQIDTKIGEEKKLRQTTSVLVANLARLGFGVDEKLLTALNNLPTNYQLMIADKFKTVMGVNKNWTPLVKGWDVPTGEDITDHLMTWFVNEFIPKGHEKRGTELPCGHAIPPNTFPLERYNGCPFCGTPFEFGKLENENFGQGSKLKILSLWTDKEAKQYFEDLLASKTALDATQIDSLKKMIQAYKDEELPSVEIKMKETLMVVISSLVEFGKPEKAQIYFKSPVDIMRYLWYKHTGFLQIVKPKVVVARKSKNSKHIGSILNPNLDQSANTKLAAKADLKLKYSRKECFMVASWLNNLGMSYDAICEAMHPKREMWVRFIRALRLAEYSKKAGFEKLKIVLDKFYNEDYRVWQSEVDKYRLRTDVEKTMSLLKQRPGLFARSLFANMLWFGKDDVLEAFSEIIDKVPARLVFTLNMYADSYFTKGGMRAVKPLGGTNKNIPKNQLLNLYDEEVLKAMKEGIEEMCVLAMKKRFEAQDNENKTIYIDPMLFKIPVSIGDRSETVQDMPSALMGTRFEIEGNTVRLFMQWGEGLKTQHLDMDLSCHVAYKSDVDNSQRKYKVYGGAYDICSYSNLVTDGCKHSGDIQYIPEKVGTAEYIDIDVHELRQKGAKYVTFTCNAYSNGEITPNLVVGWMNSKYPMTISEKTGVAYDPSCVQHQVRIQQGLTKGLVFGVLDIDKNEIVWLELSFHGQVVGQLNTTNVETLLAKLDSKLNVGNLLLLKAEAQNLEVLEENDEQNPADEVYSKEWVMNTAAVTQLLVD
ncbi:hypothetical protein [Bernardetia sp.]|uniref:hypothetical protein n=1 Tax=Bernardetia sp. TaxID=1937974 RepID=UPI0025B911D8|nr:hypothetical protein [Bernardetia sp.]